MKIRVRFTRKTLLAVLLTASLVVALLGPGPSARLRGWLQVFLVPLGDPGMYLATAFKSHAGKPGMRPISPAEAERLHDENQRLRARIEGLAQELLRAKQQVADVQAIRALYRPVRDLPCELIPARVVGGDSLPYGQTRQVNVGRRDGAEVGARVTTRDLVTDRSKALPEGLPAISALRRLNTVTGCALVGRLVETGRYTARLQLVTDRGFETAARIRRVIDEDHPRRIKTAEASETLTAANNRLIDVTARGDGAGGLVVDDVSADHAIRPGDWLVTRDDDAALPVQILIGKVAEVADHPDRPHWLVRLRIQPAANLPALRGVYLVLHPRLQREEPGP